ncbi:ANTAR domain-containing protein [Kribbella voronezhensis]|uniref:ANTAR domain-containing protein n=1 Tax=Kribbella voronezhensis TaxID=2512212 RepID=A0A4V3FIV2_9ACTN|nr:ANTAR domain-containing protein [Kribbella voronezhensis]TDU83893.1 ANTAR domain-containing protein [Kribbella voronezhensis]
MAELDRTTLLARLARLIADDDNGLQLETRLCRAYLAMMSGDGAALTLSYTEPERVTLCTTDDLAARLEDLQDVLGEGPGPTAYVTEQIAVADLRAETGQWPLFTDAARKVPGAAVLYAIPIRPWNDGVIGVLTIHQHTTELPDAGQAQFLASAIGAALVKDPPVEFSLGSGPWTTRSEIHQATGMVVAQLRISPDDALALLRAHAFSHDITLAAVAELITSRRLHFTDDAESETP